MSGYNRVYSEGEVLRAIEGSDGVFAVVARGLCCSCRYAKRAINKWERTREAFETEKAKFDAKVFDRLNNGLNKNQKWAVLRALDTKSAGLGFSELEYKKNLENATAELMPVSVNIQTIDASKRAVKGLPDAKEVEGEIVE